jgi:hypothetical protein
MVNNMICETLHPENGIAKLFRVLPLLSVDQQCELIRFANKSTLKNYANSNKSLSNKK